MKEVGAATAVTLMGGFRRPGLRDASRRAQSPTVCGYRQAILGIDEEGGGMRRCQVSARLRRGVQGVMGGGWSGKCDVVSI